MTEKIPTDVKRQLRALRAEADEEERGGDEPYPEGTAIHRPGLTRSRVLQVRLNPHEYAAVEALAKERWLPTSVLVREWILDRLDPEPTEPTEPTMSELLERLERIEAALASDTQ